jgi:hypothetical protein
MSNFFKNYTRAEAVEDILGVVIIFALPFLIPYTIAIVKAIL